MDELPSRKAEDEEATVAEQGRLLFLEVSRTTLERRAAKLGTVAGQAVALFRDFRKRLQGLGQARDERLDQSGATAGTRIDDLRRQATSHAEHWKRAAQEKAAELQRRARVEYKKARSRTQSVVRDYPLHVVLAAGVAGFVLGLAARTRRAKKRAR